MILLYKKLLKVELVSSSYFLIDKILTMIYTKHLSLIDAYHFVMSFAEILLRPFKRHP